MQSPQPTPQPTPQPVAQPPAQQPTLRPTPQPVAQPTTPPPVCKTVPKKRHPPPKGFKKWVKIIEKWIILLGIPGFILGSIPSLYILVTAHPDDSIVVHLMMQEVQAAKNRDTDLVAQIFSDQATITDAACQAPAQATIWTGLTQIQARYEALPAFGSLEHANPQVTWFPNNSSATKAYASTLTLGTLLSPPQTLNGHEQWVFAKLNGQWYITLFTYNLCVS